MKRKITTEIFIKESQKIHNNKYNYSISKYINRRTKIKYICTVHGVIEQLPLNHMNGGVCYKCNNYGKSNTAEFIKKSNIIHGNKYDYSLVNYITAHEKVKIICSKHGVFEQIPNSHLNGYGCIKCSDRYKKDKEFIINAKKIHNDIYDYSLVKYKNNKNHVKIICPIHGIFTQRPDNHINNKTGCPICKESFGEKEIRKLLEKNNINFESQKKFDECKNIFKLPFDFYLPKYNICIEYDGEQHYNPIKYFGGIKTFNKLKIRDKIKNKYCIQNNIKLIRIKYDEDISLKIAFLFS